jgi:amino acid adenylation domain-containing protein
MNHYKPNNEGIKSLTVHRAFEKQVTAFPQKVAVKFEDKSLSYEQLNVKANQFAHHLISHGVSAGDVIGLSVARSLEMIIAMLAILKCNAAYLPLDNNNPLARNINCLNEAKVKILIADHECDEEILTGRDLIKTDLSEINKIPQENNLLLDGIGEDLCYVMFTSGSTGKPKGVLTPHRGVTRLVKQNNYIELTCKDNILQFAPPSFDASTFEIWGALLNGGTLILYSGKMLDPRLLAREIKDNQVTVMWLTAALFHLIVNRYVVALAPLKIILAGGDVLYPKYINKVLNEYPHMTVINGYGPTENTTFTCCHRMTVNNPPKTNVPIGKAISGTKIHILNNDLKPVTEGEEGVIYSSGLGVALGYMNDIDKSDAFFQNADIAEGLIYNTGDLVKVNNEGNIEFIGRKDNQIKVRGFRVSLEEVQSNILGLNYVQDALVILDKFKTGDQQLVAYLNIRDEYKLTVSDVKRSLSSKLPYYMIPDLIHLNTNLSINKNGKIDKNKILKERLT